MEKGIIVCVDDDLQLLSVLREQIESALGKNFQTEIFTSPFDALEYLSEVAEEVSNNTPVIISDHLMPGMMGDEFLVKSNKILPNSRKILLTGQTNIDAISRAVNEARLFRYIPKPWDANDLKLTVEEAVKSYQLDRELSGRISMMSALNKTSKLLLARCTQIELLDKLCTLVMADTASDRGVVIHMKQHKGIYAVERPINNDKPNYWSIESAEYFPLTVLDHFQSNSQILVVNNALKDTPWNEDLYIKTHKVKSFIAIKVEHSDDFQTLIYLEKNKLGYFQPLQIEYLDMISQHANVAIENARLNEELEAKVIERTQELERKNQDIIQSIRFSQRIQNSFSTPIEVIKDIIPDIFIWYQPMEILSGDFYWFSSRRKQAYLAVIDCTGHGIPGSMLSVVAANSLDYIMRDFGQSHPDQVLAELNDRICKIFHPRDDNDKTGSAEGMEIALVKVDFNLHKIQFSGAKRPLCYFHKNELTVIQGANRPVGGIQMMYKDLPFTTQELKFEPGDRFYMFTNGITEQFDAADRRKFSPKRLRELLIKVQSLPLNLQQQAIKEELDNWRGFNEQTDDILVIGVQL